MLLGTLASAAALVLSPTPVHAGTFSVSPLRVDFSSMAQTGAVTIRNQQDGEVMVEAQAMLWEQVDGAGPAQLRPATCSSARSVFTLPPNGSQLVRVALQRPADPQRELSYRLILTEVPPQAHQGFTGLNVALAHQPADLRRSDRRRRSRRSNGRRDAAAMRRLDVTARNAGSAHAHVLQFLGRADRDGRRTTRAQTAAYILPDQARTWMLDIHQKDGTSGTDWRRLRVKGITEAGDFELEISPDGG